MIATSVAMSDSGTRSTVELKWVLSVGVVWLMNPRDFNRAKISVLWSYLRYFSLGIFGSWVGFVVGVDSELNGAAVVASGAGVVVVKEVGRVGTALVRNERLGILTWGFEWVWGDVVDLVSGLVAVLVLMDLPEFFWALSILLLWWWWWWCND